MRHLLIALAFACAALAQTTPATNDQPAVQSPGTDTNLPAKPPEKAHVAGQVLNEETGEPLHKATITLYSTESQNHESLEAATDASGKYHVDDLEPGKYNLHATRNGFVQRSYGAKTSQGSGTVLSVGPGGSVEANFKLTPHSVVTGKVVDEDGEPMPNVQVNLSRFQWPDGKRTLIPSGTSGTNDLGEYRIFGIGPGKYFVSATYNSNQWTQSRVTADTPDTAYAPVYYPGTTDSSSATPIQVPKGGHLNGVDFAMQKTRSYRVTGHVVTSVPGQSKSGGVRVMLMPKSTDASYSWGSEKMKGTDPEGNFTFVGVAPGSYELTGNTFGADVVTRAHAEVSITHENIKGLTLNLVPGWEMKGTLRVEGDAPAPDLTGIRLWLEDEPLGISRGPRPSASVRPDGSFTLKDVASQHYRLRTWGLPDGYYVKSARAGSADLLDQPPDFGTLQGAAIEVVVSPKGAVAEGNVKDDKDNPVTTGTVVLVPEAAKRSDRSLFHRASLDQYGHYKIKGITPGSYSLYAFQDVEEGIWEDPDFLKTAEKEAIKVTLAESADQVSDLKVIVGAEN